MSDFELSAREGLPEGLRVLIDEIPREAWKTHRNFGGMVQFWLQRHVMFREILDRLTTETRGFTDKHTAFTTFAPRLSRLGGFFLQELHMHHHVEDSHYFPQLMTLDARLERGFSILDSDHHALDGLLKGFANSANEVIRSDKTQDQYETAARLGERLTAFEGFLNRHLTDEEDLIVPVILKTGFQG